MSKYEHEVESMRLSIKHFAERTYFDLAPLRHPLWWVALALLLINDNLLKGHALVPNWLTGKLSDFAFLVVAPVVCAALLPIALPARRTLAFVSVVGLFVAADLSLTISTAVVAVAARLGMTWQLWPDTTDLIALSVLPVTLKVMRARLDLDSARAQTPRVRERIGVVVGALACLATSAPPRHPHSPFFVNRTHASIDLRVTWLLRAVDCATVPQALAATLDPSDLDDPKMLTIASGQVAALSGQMRPGQWPVGKCDLDENSNNREGCVAAILEAEHAQPIIMVARAHWEEEDDGAWFSCSNRERTSKCRATLDIDEDPGPDAVSLVGTKARLSFRATRISDSLVGRDGGIANSNLPMVRVADVDLAAISARPLSPNGCRSLRDQYHALLASTACENDGDCQGFLPIAIPGDAARCAVYTNKDGPPDEPAKLHSAWSARCASVDLGCTEAVHPAICADGTCGPSCPDAHLATCPVSCSDMSPPPTETVCIFDGTCLDETGNECRCSQDYRALVCQPQRPVPGCAIRCAPRNSALPQADAGEDAGDGPVDAGGDKVDGGEGMGY